MLGRLDNATRHVMAQARCGRPDIERNDDSGCTIQSGRRQKRYAAGTTYMYRLRAALD